VTTLAAKDSQGTVRVIAVNYDEAGKHSEVFPLTLIGLADGNYSVREEYLSGRVLNTESVVTGGSLRREISLSASDGVLLSVTRK